MQPLDYDAIQRRVTVRVQRRYRFFIHTALFFVGMPIIGGGAAAPIFIFWVAIWVFHLIYYNYQNHLEQAIDDEIELEYERQFKRKRDTLDILDRYPDEDEDAHEWLGDDGELIGYDESSF